MKDNNEIIALLHLIDDPDEDVYETVCDKIFTLGKDIIPNLENLWENTSNDEIQERIEILIHRLHFRDLTDDFIKWAAKEPDLINGAILVARYHYPDMDAGFIYQEIEKLRRNTWLELNNYLTPIEEINIVTSIFYNYYKQKGVEFSYTNPDDYLINKTLESKKGNALSNGIIYIALCQLLDLPVNAVNIPKQLILAYYNTRNDLLNPNKFLSEEINFFIDPLNGQMYSHQDVDAYFVRISLPPITNYFRKQNNKQIIQYLLKELSKCFDNDRNRYKMDELIQLANLLA